MPTIASNDIGGLEVTLGITTLGDIETHHTMTTFEERRVTCKGAANKSVGGFH